MDNDNDLLSLARREVQEETGLTFEPVSEQPIKLRSNGRKEYYFVAKNIQGEAKLGGPEKDISTPDYHFELKWVDIAEIKKINLLPRTIIKYVLKYKNAV
jgi:8-oxo-dGTP pyrophosphatase MutT (NUDIX family)